MRIRSRKLAAMFVIAGTALALSPVAAAFAEEGDASGVGTFRAFGDANGIGLSLEQPNSGSAPVPAQGLVPNAYAELSSGPAGFALSTIAWPGPLVGNAGGLANVVGTPLPPDVVANANDPVKVQAQSSGGARDEQSIGPMYALVDGHQSVARSTISDFTSPGVASAARVFSRARTYIDDSGALVSEAVSELQGVEIAGLVKIDNIMTSTTVTTSDGETFEPKVKSTLTGVSIQDQKFVIDETGMHTPSGDEASPTDPIADGINQIITNMGMTAFVTKPAVQKIEGGAAIVRSGSVVLFWQMDPNTQSVVTLGGAAVTIRATPGGGGGLADLGGGDSFLSGSGTVGDLGGGGSFDPGGFSSPSSSGGGGGGGTSGGNTVQAPFALGGVTPVSDRVPFGWMLIGIIGALMLGSGLHGLRTKVLEGALLSSVCPLDMERGTS
jgi:hypothetical protein